MTHDIELWQELAERGLLVARPHLAAATLPVYTTGNITTSTSTTALSPGPNTWFCSSGGSGYFEVHKGCGQSASPCLPSIVLEDKDEHRQMVTLTLAPEDAISAQEALKLMMLLISYKDQPSQFSALAYVKANNLERHFKFK